ncbi:NYN domain-containing protein [Rhodovulum sp. DZ06]|uniref:NYN domain-containing protein n=1 Tax=Rhodovulum sp. DZ06 TaxID=3425126 RepID=UPI003D3546C5
MRNYAFIDGEFLNKLVEKVSEEFNVEISKSGGSTEFTLYESKLCNASERVFYYDAYPESAQDSPEFHRKEAEFRRISAQKGCFVRPALTRRGRRREQKGVDVLLAVECLQHALRGNIDGAQIFTSDMDFFPLLEALQNSKTRTALYYDPDRTNPDLISVADVSIPLSSANIIMGSNLTPGYSQSSFDIKEHLRRGSDVRPIPLPENASSAVEMFEIEDNHGDLRYCLVDKYDRCIYANYRCTLESLARQQLPLSDEFLLRNPF